MWTDSDLIPLGVYWTTKFDSKLLMTGDQGNHANDDRWSSHRNTLRHRIDLPCA